jgi:hypothetical protein
MKNIRSVPETARSKAKALIAWTLRPWVRIPLKALVFVLVFLFCVVLSCVGRDLCDGFIARPKSPNECLGNLPVRRSVSLQEL